MNKFIKTKRPTKVADKETERAESKPEPIPPMLTPTPRERRVIRREASLADAMEAMHARAERKAKKDRD